MPNTNDKAQPVTKLLQRAFQDADIVRGPTKLVTAAPGLTVKDIENPAYWGNVSSVMSPWMRIDVRADDGTFYAECLVLSVGRQWARVKVLHHYPLTNADVERTETGTHAVEYRASTKWRVVRRADKAVIHEGSDTREAAEDWLTKHLRETLPA